MSQTCMTCGVAHEPGAPLLCELLWKEAVKRALDLEMAYYGQP